MGRLKILMEWTGRLSAGVLALLVILIVFDASRRYLLHEGSVALQELEWHLFDIVIMLGIASAMHHEAHVRVDLFYERFSDRLKRIVEIVTMVGFVLPFSALMIYVGYDFVMMSLSQMEGSSDPGGLPYRFLVKSLVPIAFALLLVQALFMTAAALRGSR